jgi:hypothetical protein
MVTGAPFAAGVPISAAELNKKTITYSDDIANETALPGQIYVATVDQGAWQKNDVVMRNLDDDGYVLVSQSRHRHDEDTNAAGGLLSDIFRSNIASFISFNKLLGFGPSDLMTYGSLTATIALDLITGAVKLDTIGTANNYLVSKVMGVSPSLKVPSTLKTKMQYVGLATNVFVRWGMNMEPMDLSNDNTVKYGIESCPAVNGNWNLVTADGTTRTAMDAGASLEGTNTLSTDSNARSHTLDYYPGSMLNYYYQDNTVVSKSTQLPPINSIPRSIPATNVCSFGLKTADTNAKQLYIWGLAIFSGVDDPAWTSIPIS